MMRHDGERYYDLDDPRAGFPLSAPPSGTTNTAPWWKLHRRFPVGFWVVLLIGGLTGLTLLIYVLIGPQESREHRERRLTEQCLANHGIVRTDYYGRFDGCYYGNIPDIGGNG